MPANTSLDWIEITEAAAIAGQSWLGRGDKNTSDQAAVSAMRYRLNETEISGEIVIGEGEIDYAPMLYIGEQVGKCVKRVSGYLKYRMAMWHWHSTLSQGQVTTESLLIRGKQGDWRKVITTQNLDRLPNTIQALLFNG